MEDGTMYLWLLGNPDLTKQLVATQNARSEAMSRAGYLVITALERAVVSGAGALASGYRSLARSVAKHRRRREAIAQLRSLDDRLLSDIGVARGEIAGLVDSALDRGPLTLAELRGLPQPARSHRPSKPTAAPVSRGAPVRELPKAA
jgi:uncharacterized protein YjiS (DUF1127 family)